MENKYPHLYEYYRRCKLIAEIDEDYYEKYRKEILEQEKEEIAVENIRHFVFGGTMKIHKVAE